jgi:cytochrome c biogenesis protein CcmG, thiol:disulfide interchange protein DsbE
MTDQSQTFELPQESKGLGLGGMALLFGIVLIAAVFALQLANQNRTQPTSGPAPDFSFTAYDGQPFNLVDQRGKVVLVNFWGSWCAPCREEVPMLNALYAEYGPRGVVFVGVSYLDVESSARAFIGEMNMLYINGSDELSAISRAYAVKKVPETFIIDQQGNVVEFVPAAIHTEPNLSRIRAALDRLLAVNAS